MSGNVYGTEGLGSGIQQFYEKNVIIPIFWRKSKLFQKASPLVISNPTGGADLALPALIVL